MHILLCFGVCFVCRRILSISQKIENGKTKGKSFFFFCLFFCFSFWGALVGMCVRAFTLHKSRVLENNIKFPGKFHLIYLLRKRLLVRDTNNKSLSNSNSVRSCGTPSTHFLFIINNQASLVSIACTHTHNKINRERERERYF